jgi:transposase
VIEPACLSPCSPDLSPIENAFAEREALLRKAAKHAVEGFWSAIGELLTAFIPARCRNDFAAT